MDWYKVLGLTPGAVTDREVKDAYYRLAKERHPDALKSKGATYSKFDAEHFRLISEAYDNLKTAEARQAYRFEADLERHGDGEQHWTHRKKHGQRGPSARDRSFTDVGVEFDEAEKKWKRKNYKGHEKQMRFMRMFERLIHPKNMLFVLPLGLLAYFGISAGTKAVKEHFLLPPSVSSSSASAATAAADGGVVGMSAALKRKRKEAGKRAIAAAEMKLVTASGASGASGSSGEEGVMGSSQKQKQKQKDKQIPSYKK